MEEKVRYGAVDLMVVDLEETTKFWVEKIGLQVRRRSESSVELGTQSSTLVTLNAGATGHKRRGHTGLYHLAIHIPTVAEFARVLARLISLGEPISPTDHTMSQAIYLYDPNRIMIELTLETPERMGKVVVNREGVLVTGSDGRQRGISEPMDVQSVLNHLDSQDLHAPLPEGTTIGHVHLHVNDLESSVDFYELSFGFTRHMVAPSIGMADLSAGGAFPHRLALNTWSGTEAHQPPEGSAQMLGFTLVTDTAEPTELVDPAGNKIRVRSSLDAPAK